MKFLVSVFLGWLSLVSSVEAVCYFDNAVQSQFSISMPSTLNIARDAPVGAELWSSGWVEGPSTNIRCLSTGNVSGLLASGIGAAVPGFSSNGYNSVFKTNVEGVGVSVYWCNNYASSCNTNYNNVTPIASLSWSVNPYAYSLKISWWVRLVKTGSIAPVNSLALSGVNQIRYHDLVVANLSMVGQVGINVSACEVSPQSSNITVALPNVLRSDFNNSMSVLDDSVKAKSFEISMLCEGGINVHYQVDGAASGDALRNIEGPGMATGVGIMLFRGDQGSQIVLPLGQKIFHGATSGKSIVKIPLTAKYYKTAATNREITGGDVSVVAVFTLFYE
ncbi:fimbrial protein [Pseudomonas sp. NPDC087639]|uniref:fimbrial protein n=1 Tax=Pseudomonas sp. NPDC087639 TaxID=3364445 RepID=UPI00382769BD